jgi:hypothetical protein
VFKIIGWKNLWRDQLEALDIDGRILFKWNSGVMGCEKDPEWISSKHVPMPGFCEEV